MAARGGGGKHFLRENEPWPLASPGEPGVSELREQLIAHDPDAPEARGGAGPRRADGRPVRVARDPRGRQPRPGGGDRLRGGRPRRRAAGDAGQLLPEEQVGRGRPAAAARTGRAAGTGPGPGTVVEQDRDV